jgi:uncharacterized phage protein (TIGR01671 family)
MREIKFRAWDSIQKNWTKSPYPIAAQFSETEVGFDDDQGKYILMQYTGLKDKNGKEIYEGDIVCYVDNIVVENIGGYYRTEPEGIFVEVKIPDIYLFDESLYEELEIIGNIYENPDLIK